MKQAFRQFDTPQTPYSPALTIVICVSALLFSILTLFTARQGKRHHTRFYPVEEANADQNGNPRPGTVVDRGVTAIYHFDFFLQGKRSNFNSSSFFCRLISSSQHMAGFKGRRNLRITSSFMTRSDSRLINSRTLRMP